MAHKILYEKLYNEDLQLLTKVEQRKQIIQHYVVVNNGCLLQDVGDFLKALFGLREESEGDGAELQAGGTPQPPVATNQ